MITFERKLVDRRFQDLEHQQFGRLRVIGFAGQIGPRRKTAWWCQCDCGGFVRVFTCHLKSEHTKSCGCYNVDRTRQAHTTHGLSATAEYNIWMKMWRRCESTQNAAYRHYGGRGIHVCGRWRRFENFLTDMGLRPRGLSLERCDNDGPYDPDNCIWATPKQQSRNRRSNQRLTFEGVSRLLIEWAEEFELNPATIRSRLGAGLSVAEALTQPLREKLSAPEIRQRDAARSAVEQALRIGSLQRPTRCTTPSCSSRVVEAHHHMGYSRKHKLDVVWYCRRCHVRQETAARRLLVTTTVLGV